MSRPPRQVSTTGIYHVILRSVNQQQIFEEEADYYAFLKLLEKSQKKYEFELYAYCCMSNHIHLLVDIRQASLSTIFRSLGASFVVWYNKKYQRFGHLFQERYFSKPVNNEGYFLQVLYYIHMNPVKANMVRYPAEYRWSSCHAYYGQKNELVNTQKAVEVLGSLQEVQKYFGHYQGTESEYILFEAGSADIYFTDDDALQRFQELTDCKSPSDFQNLNRHERYHLVRVLTEHHLTQEQIARFGGISRRTIGRILKQS